MRNIVILSLAKTLLKQSEMGGFFCIKTCFYAAFTKPLLKQSEMGGILHHVGVVALPSRKPYKTQGLGKLFRHPGSTFHHSGPQKGFPKPYD